MTHGLLYCWQSIDWKIRMAVGLVTFAAGMLLGATLIREPPSRLFAPAWQPTITEPHYDVQRGHDQSLIIAVWRGPVSTGRHLNPHHAPPFVWQP
jgi:hypothetical protein